MRKKIKMRKMVESILKIAINNFFFSQGFGKKYSLYPINEFNMVALISPCITDIGAINTCSFYRIGQ